jgi:hypothetical protein
MGMSAFKLFPILGAIGILFLPTLIRRLSALPTIFERFRSRIAGEDPVQDKSAEASLATINQEATKNQASLSGLVACWRE